MSTERTERVLKEAVHMFTETIEPADQWEEIERQLAHQKRRGWRTPVVASLTAAAVAALALVAFGSVDDDAAVKTGPADGSGDAATAPPDNVVLATADGRVIVARTSDGEETREIVGAVGGGVASDLQVAADGTVYVLDGGSICGRLLQRVGVDGTTQSIAAGIGSFGLNPADSSRAVITTTAGGSKAEGCGPNPSASEGRAERVAILDLSASASGVGSDFGTSADLGVAPGGPGESDPQASYCEVAWSPDGTLIAVKTCYEDGASVALFNATQNPIQPTGIVVDDATDLVFLPNGHFIVQAVIGDSGVREIDPATGAVVRRLDPPGAILDVDPSGIHFLVRTDGGLYRWSEGGEAERIPLDDDSSSFVAGLTPAVWGNAQVTATPPADPAPAPGAPDTFVGSGLEGVAIYETATGRLLKQLVPAGERTAEVALSVDGESVYVSEGEFEGSSVRQIDLFGGERASGLCGHSPSVSADGGLLVCTTPVDGFEWVLIVDAETGEEVETIVVDSDKTYGQFRLRHFSWSPDGRRLAFEGTYDVDQNGATEPFSGVLLVDIEKASPKSYTSPGGYSEQDAIPRRDPSRTWSTPTFLPDGSLVLSEIGGGRAALVKRSPTGSLVDLGTLPGEVEAVHSIAADPSGEYLLVTWSGGGEGGTYLFRDGEFTVQLPPLTYVDW